MNNTTIQDILPFVEQPSRYLGSEINAIKKDYNSIKLSMALVFPDLYEIGTSHFGLQILYHILNHHNEIAAERVYTPAVDMEKHLRYCNIPISSLESQKPLGEFDIIGFSLLYELNYTNILTILDLGGIPFLSKKRDESCPLIIAGGPCTCNPEPLADFFDAMVIGDGETVIMEMSRIWFRWKDGGKKDKTKLLKAWSRIEGVYIPSFFQPKINGSGFQVLEPVFSDYTKITRAVVPDLNSSSFPDTPVVPYGRPVHDRLRLELARGCTRGCRFCQAGMIYRPVRERSCENLLELSDKSLASTGYEDISLLSLSTGDYGCIGTLMEKLMERYGPEHIAVSLPSLRAGTLTSELMELVKQVRKTGFTIAPEAGSQRLRDVINKNITEKEITDTVQDAFNLGWQVIKLYFMIGLPTENDDDLAEIVRLVKMLRKINGVKGKKGKITVSIATFIPKAHTPFQWVPQISLEESKQKISCLKKKLRMSGIQVKWQNPEVSMLEGLWARGDLRLSELLIAAYRAGCQFDGWSDKFRFDLWEQALESENVDRKFFTERERDIAELLPWDHIDQGVSGEFLKNELARAFKQEYTPDCRNGDCNFCGVCDFERIKPEVLEICHVKTGVNLSPGGRNKSSYRKLKVYYSKRNKAKYFGHLELVKIFLRAIRRAKIQVKFSEGFHPKPKISFEDPLPIGLESAWESFTLFVQDNIRPKSLIKQLNKQLPEGLHIFDCRYEQEKYDCKNVTVSYIVKLKEIVFKKEKLERFNKNSNFVFTRQRKKGKIQEIDLKKIVSDISLLSPERLYMTLRSEPGITLRPYEIIENIFDMPSEDIKMASIIKLGPDSLIQKS